MLLEADINEYLIASRSVCYLWNTVHALSLKGNSSSLYLIRTCMKFLLRIFVKAKLHEWTRRTFGWTLTTIPTDCLYLLVADIKRRLVADTNAWIFQKFALSWQCACRHFCVILAAVRICTLLTSSIVCPICTRQSSFQSNPPPSRISAYNRIRNADKLHESRMRLQIPEAGLLHGRRVVVLRSCRRSALRHDWRFQHAVVN